MRNLKAQAAMEYLMTYGWAILIVVIVAAALFALGIFTPPTGARCTGFANLGCPDTGNWQLNTVTDELIVVLKNGLGQTVILDSVNVTIAGISAGNNTISGSTISAGNTFAVRTGGFTAQGSGDAYSAKVEITYTVGSGTLTQKDTGTLTGAAI